MKSVGEAMAIGRTFKESLQKCLRSLEIGRSGLGGDGNPAHRHGSLWRPRHPAARRHQPQTECAQRRTHLLHPPPPRRFTLRRFQLTKIDRWFLVQIKEIVILRRNWRETKKLAGFLICFFFCFCLKSIANEQNFIKQLPYPHAAISVPSR